MKINCCLIMLMKFHITPKKKKINYSKIIKIKIYIIKYFIYYINKKMRGRKKSIFKLNKKK